MKTPLTITVVCGLALICGCEKKPSGSARSAQATPPSANSPSKAPLPPRPLSSDQVRLIALGKALMELDRQTLGQYAQLMSELEQATPDGAPMPSVSDPK